MSRSAGEEEVLKQIPQSNVSAHFVWEGTGRRWQGKENWKRLELFFEYLFIFYRLRVKPFQLSLILNAMGVFLN